MSKYTEEVLRKFDKVFHVKSRTKDEIYPTLLMFKSFLRTKLEALSALAIPEVKLTIICDICGETLTEPGSLLFKPTDNLKLFEKIHICKKCI